LLEALSGQCGSYRDVVDCCSLNDCTKDIQYHLTRYHLSNDNINEFELILARAGQFNLSWDQIDRMWVCPKHRHDLGVGWKTSKTTCQYPSHGDGKKKKVKGRSTITFSVGMEIQRLYGITVPLGSRKY